VNELAGDFGAFFGGLEEARLALSLSCSFSCIFHSRAGPRFKSVLSREVAFKSPPAIANSRSEKLAGIASRADSTAKR
jgi:hypothetical protein